LDKEKGGMEKGGRAGNLRTWLAKGGRGKGGCELGNGGGAMDKVDRKFGVTFREKRGGRENGLTTFTRRKKVQDSAGKDAELFA